MEEREGAARELRIQSVADADVLHQVVDLQKETWGESFQELVPASVLKVSCEVGGVLLVAWMEDLMAGFVYGFTGPRGGRLVHWSHMLAVRPEYRNRGIGRQLKRAQAADLQSRGVFHMYWTYDPLVARNAHVNLNRLGARVETYVPDMYGRTGSVLHDFGTDRLIVRWDLRSIDEVQGRPDLSEFSTAPLANPKPFGGEMGKPVADTVWSGRPVRIRIPGDIQEIARRSISEARGWRESTRTAFLKAAERGYQTVGLDRGVEGPFCDYLLKRSSPVAGDRT